MKTVDSHPDYSVTSDGKVFSHKADKFLSLLEQRGRYHVNLYRSKNLARKQVSRIVAETYLPNPEKHPCVNHIDGNPLNNKVENLEWCTYSHNSIHAVETGLHIEPQGMTNSSFKAPLMFEKNGSGKVYFGRRDFEMDGFSQGCVYRTAAGKQSHHKGFNIVFLKMMEAKDDNNNSA